MLQSKEKSFDPCADWEKEQGKGASDHVHFPGTEIGLHLNRGRI